MREECCYDYLVVDHNNRYNFFWEYANEQVEGCSKLVALGQSSAPDVLDTIDQMARDGYDPITISISGHGNLNFVSLGGQHVYATEFRSKMEAHSNTTFNFILFSCRSGTFIDDLSDLENVMTVVTACGYYESAWFDWDKWMILGTTYIPPEFDYNPEDSGGEWTSSLLEAMSRIAGNPDYFSAIQDLAQYIGIPETSVLIAQAYYGALGLKPSFGMTQDLDFASRMGRETPQIYTRWLTHPLAGSIAVTGY
jgi:hypothetical protein